MAELADGIWNYLSKKLSGVLGEFPCGTSCHGYYCGYLTVRWTKIECLLRALAMDWRDDSTIGSLKAQNRINMY